MMSCFFTQSIHISKNIVALSVYVIILSWLYLQIWALEYIPNDEMSLVHTEPIGHVLSVGKQSVCQLLIMTV